MWRNRIIKNVCAFSSAIAGLSLGTAGQAAITFATYTGTVASGLDHTGVFGSPNSSLAGLAYSLVYSIDDATSGAILNTDGSSYSFFQGSYAASPVSATLHINNGDFSFGNIGGFSGPYDEPDRNRGQVAQVNNISFSQFIHESSQKFSTESVIIDVQVFSAVDNFVSSFNPPYDFHAPWSYDVRVGDNVNSHFRIYQLSDFGGFLANGQLSIDRVVVSSGGPAVDAAPPSDIQLAKMSVNAYSKTESGNVENFRYLSGTNAGSRTSEDQIYAEAYIAPGKNGGRDQIVVAVRGSRFEDFELRNGTFLTGVPTDSFKQSADDIAVLIRTLRQSNPDADFTLTGHSLGGALAQAVAEAVKIDAIVFDAPGAKGMFDTDAQTRLAALANGLKGPTFSASESLRNVRFYGDDVSKIGNAYAGIQTLIPSDEAIFDKIVDRQTLAGSCYFLCHDKLLLLAELESGTSPVDGIADLYQDLRLPIQGILDVFTLAKNFDEEVSPIDFLLYDPMGSGEWAELNMLDSDVELRKMYLPSFADNFEVFAFLDDSWLSVGMFDGFTEFDVPVARLYRIGNASALQDGDGNFLLGLKFASEGTFRGRISLVNISAGVPEPQTWALMLIGFGFIGMNIRRSVNRRIALNDT